MKASEAGSQYGRIHGDMQVDDLLGAVPKLSLCPLTRSAVGVCSMISGGRGPPKFLKQCLEAGFESPLVSHMVHFRPNKMADNINSLYPILCPIHSIQMYASAYNSSFMYDVYNLIHNMKPYDKISI